MRTAKYSNFLLNNTVFAGSGCSPPPREPKSRSHDWNFPLSLSKMDFRIWKCGPVSNKQKWDIFCMNQDWLYLQLIRESFNQLSIISIDRLLYQTTASMELSSSKPSVGWHEPLTHLKRNLRFPGSTSWRLGGRSAPGWSAGPLPGWPRGPSEAYPVLLLLGTTFWLYSVSRKSAAQFPQE